MHCFPYLWHAKPDENIYQSKIKSSDQIQRTLQLTALQYQELLASFTFKDIFFSSENRLREMCQYAAHLTRLLFGRTRFWRLSSPRSSYLAVRIKSLGAAVHFEKSVALRTHYILMITKSNLKLPCSFPEP
jgi:hypothetical protein